MNILSLESMGYLLIALVLYFLLPKKIKPYWLLVVSLFFYTRESFSPLLFLLSTSISVYLGARYFNRLDTTLQDKKDVLLKDDFKEEKKKVQGRKKAVAFFVILLNLSALIYFKYTNTLLMALNRYISGLPTDPLELLLPLGISFYTFQALGYLIDVYRQKVEPEKNYFYLLLFLSYFPQVIQGPIGRYKDLIPQLLRDNKVSYERFIRAFMLILWGYFKKLIIAEYLSRLINPILQSPVEQEGFTIFFSVFLYAIQIYADFSGGINIISGISELFGIYLAQNFNRPFFATSLSDFWRRWHMTLGSWMRDYVFYPVAFSKVITTFNKKLKRFGSKKLNRVLPSAVSSMVVFFLVGLWHGASLKYVAFGLFNGIIITTSLLLEEHYAKWAEYFKIDRDRTDYRILMILRTLLITTLGRYFTRAESLEHAIELFKKTFINFNPYVLFDGSFLRMSLSDQEMIVLLVSVLLLFIMEVIQETGTSIRSFLYDSNLLFRVFALAGLTLVILFFGIYGAEVDTSSFIYQGF